TRNAGIVHGLIKKSEHQVEQGFASARVSTDLAERQCEDLKSINQRFEALRSEVEHQRHAMDGVQQSLLELGQLSRELDSIAAEQRNGGRAVIQALGLLD